MWYAHINFSTPKKPAESAHEITTPAKAVAATKVEAQDTESPDEMYEVVEMQVTSSAKTRYAPAQTPQEGTVNKTQPVESEASKDSAAKGENQGAYVNID